MGEKLKPYENDRINGIWLPKSLHAFVAIVIDPSLYPKVENISQKLNVNEKDRNIISIRFFLIKEDRCLIIRN
jgi:hypothetical protein